MPAAQPLPIELFTAPPFSPTHAWRPGTVPAWRRGAGQSMTAWRSRSVGLGSLIHLTFLYVQPRRSPRMPVCVPCAACFARPLDAMLRGASRRRSWALSCGPSGGLCRFSDFLENLRPNGSQVHQPCMRNSGVSPLRNSGLCDFAQLGDFIRSAKFIDD